MPPATEPTDPAAPLLAAVRTLDLTSADGRAGIRALLAELDRLAPGAVLRQAASIELRRIGWRGPRAEPAPSASMGLPPRPPSPTVARQDHEGETT